VVAEDGRRQRIPGAAGEPDGRTVLGESAPFALDVRVVVRTALAAVPACHRVVQRRPAAGGGRWVSGC